MKQPIKLHQKYVYNKNTRVRDLEFEIIFLIGRQMISYWSVELRKKQIGFVKWN